MEQDQGVRDREQEEVWDVALAAVDVAVVSLPVPVEIVSAQIVEKKYLINWEYPALIRNVRSAAQP